VQFNFWRRSNQLRLRSAVFALPLLLVIVLTFYIHLQEFRESLSALAKHPGVHLVITTRRAAGSPLVPGTTVAGVTSLTDAAAITVLQAVVDDSALLTEEQADGISELCSNNPLLLRIAGGLFSTSLAVPQVTAALTRVQVIGTDCLGVRDV
jgi:hypothetical protein